MSMRLLWVILLSVLVTGCASRQASWHADGVKVTSKAKTLLGTPYRWGGDSPGEGFDCSGLIVYVYDKALGIQLPRTTAQMIKMPWKRPSSRQLQEGDLVFFATKGRGKVSHAGIYVGDRRFIHAPRSGAVVRIESLDTSYWGPRYLGARRVLD